MDTTIHIVTDIPQNCDCGESVCLKLLSRPEVYDLTAVEKQRIWAVHSTDDGRNWLSYGTMGGDGVIGYVLMPIRIKLPDAEYDDSSGRVWKCQECGKLIRISYDEYVEGTSRAYCEQCDCSMELMPPNTEIPAPEEPEPECHNEAARAETAETAA